jgi:outer membrane lipoprotein-sorting protein
MIGGWGCAVRRTIHVSPPKVSAPPKQATVAELVKEVDAWSRNINTMKATVVFTPTTGSIYTGIIKQYQNVGGFILLKKPALIRIIGQAPVVRTEIFDMVSDGQQFWVSIPPKNKFIVGKNNYHESGGKPLENLRPEHILDALLIPPIDDSKEKFFKEETRTPAGESYYVVNVVEPASTGELSLERRVWFDRTDLQVSQLQLFGPGGALVQDVSYSGYEDFQGIRYPAEITLNRPEEGYTLSIKMEKATFNQPLPPETFVLKKPPNASVVELGGNK